MTLRLQEPFAEACPERLILSGVEVGVEAEGWFRILGFDFWLRLRSASVLLLQKLLSKRHWPPKGKWLQSMEGCVTCGRPI